MALHSRHLAELRYRRALAAAYGVRRRPRAKLPEQRWPRAARTAYFLALKGVLTELRDGIDRLLIPQLPRLLALVQANKPEALRTDSADDLKAELDRIDAVVDDVLTTARLRRMVDRAAHDVADFNKQELNKQFRASLGIDLLHGEPYLQTQLELFAEDNARLITSLAAEHLGKVGDLVMRAARAGTRVEQLRKDIEQRFEVTQGKAQLLARDQVGKLNGELTQLRQASVGVTEYEWSTSRDERVRKRHADLEGTTHSWDDPPVVDEKTGRRAHPGQDFQCRCTALPKVDDLLNALGDLGPDADEAPRTPRPSRPPSVRVPRIEEPAE